MAEQPHDVATGILRDLEAAWNAADHTAWAALFAEDADFVTVRGDYLRTRPTIAAGHQVIFTTVYKGSTNHLELLGARALTDQLIVAHAQATLSVPAGPMAGTHHAVMSLLLQRADQGSGPWRIASFHNTFQADDARFSQVPELDRFHDRARPQP
jgi:uncharacterized protein (TIGR02246 family)